MTCVLVRVTVPPLVLVALTLGIDRGSLSWSAAWVSSALMRTLREWFCTVPRVQLVTVGAWLSRTVTAKLQADELPLASVAVQLTVVVPIAKTDPDAGLQATVAVPEHKSLAVVVNATAVPAALVVTAVRLVEHVIAGGVVSLTYTVRVAVAVLPLGSVAV